MKLLSILGVSTLVLLPTMILSSTALANGTLGGTATVEVSTDPGFEGLYKYTVAVEWDVEQFSAGHFDVFLTCEITPENCAPSMVSFASPAGTSTGEDPQTEEPCVIPYDGSFLCETDPSLGYENLGVTVKFEPNETSCETTTQGTGEFVFYTEMPPGMPGIHERALALKHGQAVEFGDVVGQLPGSSGEPFAPIIFINEFVTKPPDGGTVSEFVEVHNPGETPVNLDGWEINVNGDFIIPLDGEIPPGGFAGDSTFDEASTVGLSFDLDTQGELIPDGALVNDIYASLGVVFEKDGPGFDCGDGDEIYANGNHPLGQGSFPNHVSTCPPSQPSAIAENAQGAVVANLSFPAERVCIDVFPVGEFDSGLLQAFDANDNLLVEAVSTPGTNQTLCVVGTAIRRVRFSGMGGMPVGFDNLGVRYQDNYAPWIFAIKTGSPDPPQATGFIRDLGGVISLFNAEGALVDQVSYGNQGGAPVSVPLIIPDGGVIPPIFNINGNGNAPSTFGTTEAEPDTFATSTQRVVDGGDTNNDANDFSIGPPSSGNPNRATPPQLQTSSAGRDLKRGDLGVDSAPPAEFGKNIAINTVYAHEVGQDAIELFNFSGQTLDLSNWILENSESAQQIYPGTTRLIESGGRATLIQGGLGSFNFEMIANDVLYLYEPDLTRVWQIGWADIPTFFPDSCLVRFPNGNPPSDGYDFESSGGTDDVLNWEVCTLQNPGGTVAVPKGGHFVSSIQTPFPNPARKAATVGFTVGGVGNSRVPTEIVVFDVAGRKVRTLINEAFEPGIYRVVWNGFRDNGSKVGAGVYFVALNIGGQRVGDQRQIVWLK